MTTLKELQNHFKLEKEKTKVFKILKKNDKIMKNKSTNTLYCEAPGYLQSWKRWWYCEDKITTFHYMDTYFVQFMRFLDSVLLFDDKNTDKDIKDLGEEICCYINSIIPGIHILKDTYPEYRELHCKVDSIIITMIDFKKEYYRRCTINKKIKRKTE